MPSPTGILWLGAKRVPWIRVVMIAREGARRGSAVWRELGPEGRARLSELVSKSKARPTRNLTPTERDELKALVGRGLRAIARPDATGPPREGPGAPGWS